MARNIAIFCDGTGNEVSGNPSNVIRLFRIAERSNEQLVFYDPGVGTIASDNRWHYFSEKVKGLFGLMSGAGLDNGVLDAYRFLAEHYQDGDHIYLFGFSRGAYTVRVLAGLINMIGLLQANQVNLADFALTTYKRSSESNNFRIGWDFGRRTATRRVTIHFMGVWDTVSSMIVPRPDRLYIPSFQTLPFTRRNPSVRAFRQAISIDERRRMFRLNRWCEGQDFVIDPFSKPPVKQPQDIEQVWFAGVHSDVGCGYPEAESGLAKIALQWMVEQAQTGGLKIRESTYRRLALGEGMDGGVSCSKPDPLAKIHNSLTLGWWPLELFEKRVKFRDWPKRWSWLGWYTPAGEPRFIPETANIHPSVRIRRADAHANYNPVNVPEVSEAL